MKVTLTPEALKELDAFFADKEKEPIRIYIQYACSGAYLAIALDPVDSRDFTAEVNGYTFCMNQDLYGNTGDITISKEEGGFDVQCEKPLPKPAVSPCASCGGGCGTTH
ncbi:MAG: IscA/HesB family protein [Desulfovibrionaceae bacterium]|nr:IscA/HesB family protein [Desulfovibrionaceae bacterium]